MTDLSVIGQRETPVGMVPVVATELSAKDILNNVLVRFGVRRMNYTIPPGLYAVGNPNPESPVFVSANYKLSFDVLRQALAGIDGWILVLDTKGINVWCAAGKGTFGTDEFIQRLRETDLEQIVTHRRLIVPQLGAPGVAAHWVKSITGFRVIYGPIRAADIKAFMEARLKATPEMRQVTFGIRERLAVMPLEIVTAMRYWLLLTAAFILLAALTGTWSRVFDFSRDVSQILKLTAAGFIAGAIFGPLLLFWLPGRSFALKGSIVGFLTAVITLAPYENSMNGIEVVGWIAMISAISSFLLMNFTGSTPYTSLSGVLLEMKYALPAQITVAVIGLIVWIIGRLI